MKAERKGQGGVKKRGGGRQGGGAEEGERARRERLVREQALRDLEGLKHEGGGFGGGWTHSALVRSLLYTRSDRDDFTPTLRRIVVVLRVLAFVLLSLWFLWVMTNR